MKQDAVIKIFKTDVIFLFIIEARIEGLDKNNNDNIAFVVCKNNENDYNIDRIEENEPKVHTMLTHFSSKSYLLLGIIHIIMIE